MPDRHSRGKSVEDRLSRRFGEGKSASDAESETDDAPGSADNERAAGQESDTSDKSGKNTKSDTKVKNVKEAWNSKLVYLPDELDDPLDAEYDRLVYQCGRELSWKPKKNRHYYPVVVADGVETVSEMDPQTFRDRVADLGLL
jgi:hypothetical protein